MLLKCPECGKEVSKNARICPHCKCNLAAARKVEMKPCRICKTPLLVTDHLSMEYKSTPWIIDRSSVTATLKYTPCPKCGESRPILPTEPESPLQKWALPVLIVIGLAVAAYLKYGN